MRLQASLALLIALTFFAPAQPAQAGLPSGWSDTDIGSPGVAGSASYSNGVWTVSGSGGDIWNAADQFNFAGENWSGDGTLIARVTSLQNTDPASGWAKVGVMFRNDLSAGAVNAALVITPGNGVSFQWRSAAGGQSSYSQVSGVTAPVWIELVRSGSSFSAYYGSDGTHWTQVGASQPLAMNSSIQAGLAVTAHNNAALNTATFDNVGVWPPVFGVYREQWINLNTSLGNTLTVLTNTSYNPNWPNNPNAAATRIFTTFETEINSGINNYGQRVRAFVVPPVTGAYTFWIASDDSSQLFLSTDENPAHKAAIAGVTTWTPSENWTEYPSQQSAPINLQSGSRYYIEAIMQQGGGGDNLSVRWQLPNGSFEQPMSAISGAGTLLIACNGVDTLPGIFIQPANVTAVEGSSAMFSLLVTNEAPVNYQWLLNGSNLTDAGAIKPFYMVSNASLSLSGQLYSCIVSNSTGSITSAPAMLSVIRDTVPPAVTRAFNLGVTNVEVVFSKPVEPASATNIVNYVFTNGLTISGASLGADNVTVTLTTAPLVYGSNYSMVINNVRDRAAAPNTIAANTPAGFVALPYVLQDIGNPPFPSALSLAGSGVTVSGGGKDVGGSSDQFTLSYQSRTGNFDVSVRVAGMALSDVWAKAGLMARASLDPGSPFAASFATPAMAGCFLEYRSFTNGLSSTTGSFPANYPNTWLRLKRVGNLFTSYAGYDGQNWTTLGSIGIAMPGQIFLGLSVSSYNSSQSTTAQFQNFADVTNGVVATVANPHEPIGPSSRMSPIVISEIMYKPAPRADTNNLEYLELYNSNPWFQDISGYQLVCDNLSYTFPAGTVMAGGSYLVVAASPASIQNVYGITNVLGPYTGSLKKSGTLQLLDEQGAVLLIIPYSNANPWPVAADGTGHSLVLANPTYGEGDPRAWDISDVAGGSPGVMETFRPSPLRSVVINEFLAHTDPPFYDYIELYNHSLQTVDLSGCILTDDPNTNRFVIPPGTLIPPRGFAVYYETNMGFGLKASGQTIYFRNPDASRILDAVSFEGQEHDRSMGRWPEGTGDFYSLLAPTPGTNNSAILIRDIVINELMYNPISGNDDDQYVELYNKGTNAVSLAGWQFVSGISYTFPTNAGLAPGAYLVIARNQTNLFAKYTNLNSGNTLGNFNGKLSHNGERLALAMPDELVDTNTLGQLVTNISWITMDEVTYGTGGRWGQWSSGGGSSLELMDPHSNHRLAANWGDSDETHKSAWVNIETTGVLNHGINYDPSIDYAQVGLLDVGECLVDNLEVHAGTGGTNYVANPDFESGLGNWTLQGCLVRSSLENEGYASGHSLHLRCSDRMWTGVNSCEVALWPNTMAVNQTATLRFKARWLHGWPEVLFRLNGNWLEATGPMPVPANLGTPGMPNSRYVTNAGPAIAAVTHSPSVPAANQAVVVTARVHDPDGLQSFTLNYRIDPATTYTTVVMRDDGLGGDAIAGDGIYSATIPGQNTGTIAAFYLLAADPRGAVTRFPALLNDNAPVRECVVMFGDGNSGGSFGVYHLWITQTNATRWSSLSDLSNETHDCTIVNGNRVIYDAQGRFAGSPYHQQFDTPYGNLCHYKWIFPEDDKFLGATSFNKIHQPGNGAGDDGSIQREQLAYTFMRALGVPWLNRRYVAVYVNGNRRGFLMEDTQVPDSDVVKEHFPNDTGGFLYKMQPWFEFGPNPSGISIPFNNNSWCNLVSYTTTGGVKKPARYRYMFEMRRTPDSASNFTNVFSLVDAANSSGTPNYVANMENMADMENWMRVFAANHAAGNWDSFGTQNSQNLYGYIGAQGTKYTLMMWDYNIVIGNSGSWGPGQNLFTVNSQDPNMAAIYNNPTFRRMYWRALQELVNGPLNVNNSGPLLDAKYNDFVANGLTVEDPNSSIKPWLSQAQSSIATQIAAENAPNFTVNPSVIINNDVARVSGTAPVNVKTVWFNGVEWPVTWTSVTSWTVTVPLRPGTNQFSVVGVDIHGQIIAGTSNNVSAVYNGTLPPPTGQVVINEIMFNPLVPNAEYVELYNTSATVTFDLSGWQFKGLAYTFPAGSFISPNSFLVLAANRPAFAAAYGATSLVFDTFSGTLQTDGETLSLLQPGTNGTLTVAEVKYEAVAPWPVSAIGSSLQLLDARQDNWRAGNWANAAPTPGRTNNVAQTLPVFPPLWLNELQADNLTGLTNSAGQHVPWLELYNPTTNTVSLSGLYLANSYSNPAAWVFPAGASINPGQFKVIFADGQTNLSTLSELHTSFILPSGAGSLALSRLYNGQPQVMDYINYTNLTPNHSYGSLPDGQSFVRLEFYLATPGSANNPVGNVPPSFIAYSAPEAIYTQDFDALPDPGAVSVNTANPVTINGITYSLANPFDFAFPVIASGNIGGLGINALSGWYGLADSSATVGTRFGATDGDQTTGGQVSFGLPGSGNRALGLLATSTTGFTGVGAKLINQTSQSLNYITLRFTGEVWRQSDLPKTLEFYYFVDPTGTNAFSTNYTAFLPGLNVSFPTVSGDVGGAAVDGTAAVNQTNLGVFNQVITNWPPGAALWLVWEMASPAGKSQGLAIDDLSFTASDQPMQAPTPALAIGAPANNNPLILSWPGSPGWSYQVEYKTNLADASWTAWGGPLPGNGATLSLTNPPDGATQRFFRVRVVFP